MLPTASLHNLWRAPGPLAQVRAFLIIFHEITIWPQTTSSHAQVCDLNTVTPSWSKVGHGTMAGVDGNAQGARMIIWGCIDNTAETCRLVHCPAPENQQLYQGERLYLVFIYARYDLMVEFAWYCLDEGYNEPRRECKSVEHLAFPWYWRQRRCPAHRHNTASASVWGQKRVWVSQPNVNTPVHIKSLTY